MKQRSTKRCIVCLSPKVYLEGGHVRKGQEIVVASWCVSHNDVPSINLMGYLGCYGPYSRVYGLRKTWRVL